MNEYQLFILVSLGLLTVIVITLGIIWRKRLGTMQGMITSMFFGMNVGLTAGVLLGVTYQGNMFLSTMLSMAIGILAGSLCGICFGILSTFEGLMAGLMGGMMGAMLGEMINLEQSLSFIRFFLFLSISTIFILNILINDKSKDVKNAKWLLKPLLLATFIIAYFIGSDVFAESLGNKTNSMSFNNHHLNTDESSKNSNEKNRKVDIGAVGMQYTPAKIIVEKDEPVLLSLENLDRIEHDLEINMPFRNMSNKSKHEHSVKPDVIHIHASPNSTETVTFTPTASGLYEFVCTIPGHKESGMVGEFIVR